MGQDTSKHEIQKELERVKGYMAKIKAAETPGGKPQNRAGFVVDKEVAERLIRQGITEDTTLPKEKMSSEIIDKYLHSINNGKPISKDELTHVTERAAVKENKKRSRELEDQGIAEVTPDVAGTEGSKKSKNANKKNKKDKKKKR
jgi:hypothetical protein